MNQGQKVSYGPEIIPALLLEILLITIQGIALWKSARFEQKKWFIILFICAIIPIPLLTFVDIIYLFKFAKKKLTFEEIKSWVKRQQAK